MIETIEYSILFGLLTLVFYQDWKTRSVHVLVFPVLFGVGCLLFSTSGLSWMIVLQNLLFALLIIATLMLVVMLREQERFKSLASTTDGIRANWTVLFFQHFFGLGDLIFLLAVTPLFSQRNYMFFVIGGLIFTLIFDGILMRKREDKTNPLAAYLALVAAIMLAANIFFRESFTYIDLF